MGTMSTTPRNIIQRLLEDDTPGFQAATPVSDPGNDLSDTADAVEDAATRLSGLVNRRANLNLSGKTAKELIARLAAVQAELSELVELIDH